MHNGKSWSCWSSLSCASLSLWAPCVIRRCRIFAPRCVHSAASPMSWLSFEAGSALTPAHAMKVPYTWQLRKDEVTIATRCKLHTMMWAMRHFYFGLLAPSFVLALNRAWERLTFDDLGEEVGGAFGLLHPIALHDLAVAVDADVPWATRLALTVQHGRVRHVVVLEHALFKLTLWVKVFLGTKQIMKSGRG